MNIIHLTYQIPLHSDVVLTIDTNDREISTNCSQLTLYRLRGNCVIIIKNNPESIELEVFEMQKWKVYGRVHLYINAYSNLLDFTHSIYKLEIYLEKSY